MQTLTEQIRLPLERHRDAAYLKACNHCPFFATPPATHLPLTVPMCLWLRLPLERHPNSSTYAPHPSCPPWSAASRLPLSSLELSVRVYNALRRAGYTYADEISGLTDAQLCCVKLLGPESVREIRTALSCARAKGLGCLEAQGAKGLGCLEAQGAMRS